MTDANDWPDEAWDAAREAQINSARMRDSAALNRILAALAPFVAEIKAAAFKRGVKAERLRLQGPPIDLAAQRAGMLAAGISAKTIDQIHASPAFAASHLAAPSIPEDKP